MDANDRKGEPGISGTSEPSATVFHKRDRRKWILWIMMWILFLPVIVGLFILTERSTIYDVLEFTFVGSVVIIMLCYQFFMEAPGEVHFDGNGLTFHKRKRSRAIPWSDFDWIRLKVTNRRTLLHLHLIEPFRFRPGDFVLLYSLMDLDDGHHVLIHTGYWVDRDIREMYKFGKRFVLLQEPK